ncbi:HAD family hydrolase [Rheinheimera sp.]|uniref:HAD family hydrolase n=1 Tax=Rheinheimera sp. TaxID=1869214 RepID=UPI003AF424AD
MLKTNQAVLFDLDGTLVDTARDLGAALNHVLQLHGQPVTHYEQYRPVASHGVRGLLQLGFGDALATYPYDLLRQQFLDYYQQHNGDTSVLFPGGDELLAFLRSEQIPWGIVTNKPYRFAAQICRALQLNDCRILIGGDSLHVRKPDPIPLWVAAHQLGVPPADCWYLGDAERDIEAGRRAGMQTVLAGFGYLADSDQPDLWQADCRIDSLLQLTDFLHKSV